ncbi:S-adenosylmethionine synthetase [Corynebacterium sp.]|uniref:S-adenosylmethionine synthetase n=1 Tax=Corynebacterium sp. TaxID=1720 RepID=UPI0027BA2610|nr:S-adenosylmethionine synthetase [Corynebacterium sp.]
MKEFHRAPWCRTAALLAVGCAGILAACSAPSAPEPGAEDATATSSAARADFDLRAELDQAIAEVESEYDVRAGVAIADDKDVTQEGLTGEEPTWSTVKVPIAIAALRAGASTDLVDLAIKQSDNDAAWALWSQVAWTEGNAAEAVEALVEDYGSHAHFEETFGYSTWLLADQAVFGSHLPCIPEAEYVYDAMDDIVQWQHNGLDALPNTRAKGGWGLSELDNGYTHRQFGVRNTEDGAVGLAIEVTMPGEDMNEAIPALNVLATRVDEVVTDALEAGAITPRTECAKDTAGKEGGTATSTTSRTSSAPSSTLESTRRFGSAS